MAAPDKQHTINVSGNRSQIPLEEMSRDEPLTPPPLPNKGIKMTSSLSLETNGSNNLTDDGVDQHVTSTEEVKSNTMDLSNSNMDTASDSLDTNAASVDTDSAAMEINNKTECRVDDNETSLVIADLKNNIPVNGISDNEMNQQFCNNESNRNGIDDTVVNREVGNIVVSNISTVNAMGTVESNINTVNAMGTVDSNINTVNAMGTVESNISTVNAMGTVDSNINTVNAMGTVESNISTVNVMNTVESNVLSAIMTVQQGANTETVVNNVETISQDIQVRPPFKGVMVPCPKLKEYLDSLPTFHRKTMLRKGREVHKIYVDLKKGECFLDDQFSYTEFGKLVLTNGSIRAGRAKNAKQIVVARETLYCSGTGSCKRACGGFGICAPGCEKTKMRGHRCGYRVKLTQRLGYVNFWFVEVLGSHDQLGAKDKNVYDTDTKLKLPFVSNFTMDLTNTLNESVKPKGRSPANHSKLIARFKKTHSSPSNGNSSTYNSDSYSSAGAVSYHYVLDSEPMGLPSPSHNSRDPTPIDLSDTSPMRELYSNESSQQAIDMYQKHVQEAAINAIKSQAGYVMSALPSEETGAQDLSGKTFSSPLLVNVKQEPVDSHSSPFYLPKVTSSSPVALSLSHSHSPRISYVHNTVMSNGDFHDRPLQKMQAAQETLGQVHNRIMERAKSRKSSRTFHIPRDSVPESKQSNKDFIQTPNHLQIPVVPPVPNLTIPDGPSASSGPTGNIDFKRFQTLNRILQSEAFQTAKQQLENSWNQSLAKSGFQTSALNLTKKEPETGDQLDHTRLLEEWRKGGQLQEFQQFHIKKESLPNGNADSSELSLSSVALTKNEKDLLCRVHQLEAHVKQLQHIVIKKDSENNNMAGKRTKPQRPFDFNKYNTRHVALKIAYLGWDYQGFAVQEDLAKTIEAVLFDGLIKTRLIESRETSNFQRCGRTDKGVSAFGQVVSLDVRTNLLTGVGVKVREGGTAHERPGDKTTEVRYVRILNAVLPPEIRVLAWAPVNPDFSARFSCKRRTYKYIFPKGKFDIQVMEEAAKKLVGEHDFRNLCKADVRKVTNYVRVIQSAEITVLDEKENGYTMCELTIVGSAFLWHQIRCIFGILVLVGEGHESPQIVDELLDVEKNPRKPTYAMAADIPLILFDSDFGEEFEWIYEADCHEDNIRSLQTMWAQHAVKAAMLKRILENLDNAKVETDCDIAPWSDLSPPVLSQTDWLTMGTKFKVYKPLMDRQKCDSLEDRMESLAKKRKLNSGEEEQTGVSPTEEAD